MAVLVGFDNWIFFSLWHVFLIFGMYGNFLLDNRHVNFNKCVTRYFHRLIILKHIFIITNFHWRKLIHRETSILPRFTAYKWWKLYLDPGTQILVAVLKFIYYWKRPQSLFKGLRGQDSRRWGTLEMAQNFQHSYSCNSTHIYLLKMWEIC